MNFTAHYSSSAGNLYTVDEGERRLIIEAGVPIKKIREALNHRLSDYQDCLCSHSHSDHARSCRDLMKAGIDVVCSAQTANALGIEGYRLKIVYPGSRFLAGGFQCLAFETEHDCPGSLGFLIMSPTSRLVFITDSYFVRKRFLDLTHICVEANYSQETLSPDMDPVVRKRLLTSHFSLEHALEFIGANMGPQLRETHLLHLSRENSDAEKFREEIQQLTGKPCYIAGE